MDTKIIEQHLKWVRSLESEYRYIEQAPEEFGAFFETMGAVSGGTLGANIGGWAASGLLAAILQRAGRKLDKALGL